MKNALYFMLKALFILKIFTIFSWLFDHVGKRFDKKANVDFKIMTSQIAWQIVTIHILPKSQEVKTIRQRNLVS